MPSVKTLKKIVGEFDEKSSSLAKCLGGGKLRILASMIYCLIRYGARPIDYERFEFFRKSRYERNRYMTFLRYFKVFKSIDSETRRFISGEKRNEYEAFADYIHRKWMIADLTTDPNLIRDMIAKCGSVIAKPEHGEQGHGIFVIKANDESALRQLQESLASDSYMLEEIVSNHPLISRINPSSLNTVRATTYIDKEGQTHIFSIILRVGAPGSKVDNWGAGGVGYNFDVESGICNQPGKDKKNRTYLRHPGSDIKMIGFELPDFPKLKEYIIGLSKVVPKARYVGWDIALTPDGYELIEMNCPAGHDMFQSFDNPFYSFYLKNR